MKTPYQTAVWIVTLAIASSACQRSSKYDAVSLDRDGAVASKATSAEITQPAKWPMPKTMKQHILNLEQDVRTLETSADKDHAALASKIDGHTTLLISSCTMDGEAHDALHDWLMPFLQLNKDYAAAKDADSRAAGFRGIQESLAAFHERFE